MRARIFYHFPAVDDGLEGYYVAVYSDPETEPDRSHRALIELVRALDLRACQWYLYAVASCESHWNTLMALEPYVQSRMLPQLSFRLYRWSYPAT